MSDLLSICCCMMWFLSILKIDVLRKDAHRVDLFVFWSTYSMKRRILPNPPAFFYDFAIDYECFCLGISIKFFFFRLKEVADRINRLGHNLHPALSNLHVGVKRICLGSTCIALLLEDGRVCRISYNILPERLDLSKNDSKR